MVAIELVRSGRKPYVVHVQGIDDIDTELARIPALLTEASDHTAVNPLADIEAINDFADLLLEQRHAMTANLVPLIDTTNATVDDAPPR